MAQLEQIHLGVAAANFLATWNKKPFEAGPASEEPRNDKPGSLTHSLMGASEGKCGKDPDQEMS